MDILRQVTMAYLVEYKQETIVRFKTYQNPTDNT